MIKVEHIRKNFGQLHALKDVSLEVNQGEIVSLIGPSAVSYTHLTLPTNREV